MNDIIFIIAGIIVLALAYKLGGWFVDFVAGTIDNVIK